MASKSIYDKNIDRDSIYTFKVTKKKNITISDKSYEKNENFILKGFRIKIASYDKKIVWYFHLKEFTVQIWQYVRFILQITVLFEF